MLWFGRPRVYSCSETVWAFLGVPFWFIGVGEEIITQILFSSGTLLAIWWNWPRCLALQKKCGMSSDRAVFLVCRQVDLWLSAPHVSIIGRELGICPGLALAAFPRWVNHIHSWLFRAEHAWCDGIAYVRFYLHIQKRWWLLIACISIYSRTGSTTPILFWMDI
jgi:hypothetical protein